VRPGLLEVMTGRFVSLSPCSRHQFITTPLVYECVSHKTPNG
jgi:hypothetical protein